MLKQLKNNIMFAVLSLLLLAFLVLIGPMNAFQHGYYANEVDVTTILNDDLAGTYDLTNGEYTTTFIPAKKHMAGVEVYIAKQDSTQGSLILTIEDDNGKRKYNITKGHIFIYARGEQSWRSIIKFCI